jgi:hypothetical protein
MSDVTTHSFQSTFYDILSDDIPDLSILHEMSFPELDVPRPIDQLDRDAQGTITKAMCGIAKICKRLELIPHIVELAVIADNVQLKDRDRPFFTSFIRTQSSTPESLVQCYMRAMDDMTASDRLESIREPIVTHPGIYDGNVGYISATMTCDAVTLRADQGNADSDDTVIYGYRYSYDSNLNYRSQAPAQVKQFVDFLTMHLNEQKNIPGIEEMFLVLIPFSRNRAVANVYGEAGGCLFVFCRPKRRGMLENATERRLVRDLSWWLNSMFLRESRTSVRGVEEHRMLLSGMLHTALNTINAVDVSQICELMMFSNPDRKIVGLAVDDLRFRLIDKKTQKEDPESERRFVQLLDRAIQGTESAASLLSFAEVGLNPELLRAKFQSDRPYSLLDTVRAAVNLANSIGNPNREDRKFAIAAFSEPPTTDLLAQIELPSGYLKQQILRGLLAEIIINARKHGDVQENIVPIIVKAQKSAGATIEVEIRNPVPRSPLLTQIDVVSGWLERVAKLLERFRSIRIYHRVDRGHFVVVMSFGRLNAEDRDGNLRSVGPRTVIADVADA